MVAQQVELLVFHLGEREITCELKLCHSIRRSLNYVRDEDISVFDFDHFVGFWGIDYLIFVDIGHAEEEEEGEGEDVLALNIYLNEDEKSHWFYIFYREFYDHFENDVAQLGQKCRGRRVRGGDDLRDKLFINQYLLPCELDKDYIAKNLIYLKGALSLMVEWEHEIGEDYLYREMVEDIRMMNWFIWGEW
jgi:hypothetical protein